MVCLIQLKEGAEILMDYCAQALDPARRAEIEHHVESCANCRELVEKQAKLWEMLDQWQTPAVSSNFDARLYARIAREEAGPAWKKWARRIFEPAAPVAIWKPAVSLAAACAVLATALTVNTPQHQTTTPQLRADQVDIEQVAKALDDLDLLAPPNSM
jgi:anti-sigma-K factor RskA